MSEGAVIGGPAPAPATPDNFAAAMGNWSAPQSTTAPPATAPTAPTTGLPVQQSTTAEPAPVVDPAQTLQQPTEAEQLVAQQAADPLAEQVHGMAAKDVLEAIKKGEIPESLATQLKYKVVIDGQEHMLSVDEIASGHQRLGDYRRKTQALAQDRGQLEQVKARMRGIFADWEKPEGFAKGMDQHGLGGNARAYVTRNWGTPQQPNVEGFQQEMRRLGHWGTFQKAANAYAEQFGNMLERFAGGQNLSNPQVYQHALQMVQRYEAEQDGMWNERLKAERVIEATQRQNAAMERQRLLQQQQVQQQPQASPQEMARIQTAKASAFQRYGIAGAQNVDLYFHENLQAVSNSLRGSGASLEYVIQRAAADTATQLREEGLLVVQQQVPALQQAPQQQQAQQLPPRPTAAPAATGPNVNGPTNRTGGTPDDFLAWTGALSASRR